MQPRLAPVALLALASCANLDGIIGDAADGGADAPAVEASSGGSRWCDALAPKPLFCADFDGARLDEGWPMTNQMNGTVAQSAAHASSPPFSLHAATAGVAGAATVDASLVNPFAMRPLRVLDLAYDLRLGTYDTNVDIVTGQVALVTVQSSFAYSAAVIVSAPTPFLEESYPTDGGADTFVRTPLAWTPSSGGYARVELRLDLGARTVSVTIGGAPALTAHPLPAGAVTTGALAPQITVGLTAFPEAGGMRASDLDVDDVTFDMQP